MSSTAIKVTPEEKELVDRIQRGDLEARNKLVMKYYPLVVKLTRPYRNKGFNRDDLIQEGVIGLIRASRKFDYRKGVKFTTYACYWVKQAIQMFVLKNSNIVKVPIRKSLDIARIKKKIKYEQGFSESNMESYKDLESKQHLIPKLYQLALGTLSLEYINQQGTALKDFLGDSKKNGPYATLYQEDLRKSLKHLMKSLTPQERHILILRFGLEDGVSSSLRLIGEMYAISPESVRKIEKRAINKLKFHKSFLKGIVS